MTFLALGVNTDGVAFRAGDTAETERCLGVKAAFAEAAVAGAAVTVAAAATAASPFSSLMFAFA